jgi:hypothetical protein
VGGGFDIGGGEVGNAKDVVMELVEDVSARVAETLMPKESGIRKFDGSGRNGDSGIRGEDGVEMECRRWRVRTVGV